jgi:hypothetical protein
MSTAPTPTVSKPAPRSNIYTDETVLLEVARYRKLNQDLVSIRRQAEQDAFVKTGIKTKLPISEEEKRVKNEKRRVENIMYTRKLNKKLE